MRAIKEQTILITGATSGLGKELAQALAKQGATVLLHGRGTGSCNGSTDQRDDRQRVHRIFLCGSFLSA
jgi:NADP-dependent 3-hydroxy acid dehydrogenase YdfG